MNPYCISQIMKESEEKNEEIDRAKYRLRVLDSLYPNSLKLPSHLKGPAINFGWIRPKDSVLKATYEEIVQIKRSKNKEMEVTKSERIVLRTIKRSGKKVALRSVWIGNCCFDLFIPNVRAESMSREPMRGLAIEVDGDVHDREDKMRKDAAKYGLLQVIGIGCTSIPNWDLREQLVREMLQGLIHLKPLDSRERRRLWRRIYLLTIALNIPNTTFIQVFLPKWNLKTEEVANELK